MMTTFSVKFVCPEPETFSWCTDECLEKIKEKRLPPVCVSDPQKICFLLSSEFKAQMKQFIILSMIFTIFFAFARTYPIISAKSARQLANASGQMFQAVMENDHWKSVTDIQHKMIGAAEIEPVSKSISHPSSQYRFPNRLNSLTSKTGKVLHGTHIH